MNTQKTSTKIKYLFLFGLLISLAILSLISADVNMTIPAKGSNITSITLTFVYVNGTDTTSPVKENTTFRQNASGGTFTTITLAGALTCTTTQCSIPATASELEDGLNQNIWVSLGNASDIGRKNSSINSTNINIYTSNVSCAFSTDKDIVDYLDPIGIATTQSSTKDSLASFIYSWALWDSNINSQDTSTASAPTFTETDFDEIGTFTLSLTARDSFGNYNTCSNKSIFIKANDGDDVPIVTTGTSTTASKVSNNYLLLLLLGGGAVIVIIIVGVGFILIQSSKGKKRG